MLSKKEQYDLIVKAKNGDKKALNLLFKHNEYFIYYCIKHIKHEGVEFEDILQEARYAFCHTIKRFDIEKYKILTTYLSHWIRYFIDILLDNKSSAIRYPRYLSRLNRAIKRIVTKYIQDHEVYPPDEYIYNKLPKTLKMYFQYHKNDVVKIIEYKDIVEENHLVEEIETKELEKEIERILENTDYRTKEIIKLRWLDDNNTVSLRKLSEKLKISPEWIRKIQDRWFKKMRSNPKIIKIAKEKNII